MTEICAGTQTILDQSPHLGLPALCLEALTAPVMERIREPQGQSAGCKESQLVRGAEDQGLGHQQTLKLLKIFPHLKKIG